MWVFVFENREIVEALKYSFSACMIKPLVLVRRRDFPPTTKLATILGISRVFWGYFLVVLNWFHHLFSEFLQDSELVGILVFHTSTPCSLYLAAFSFWEAIEVHAACIRPACLYMCPTFTQTACIRLLMKCYLRV